MAEETKTFILGGESANSIPAWAANGGAFGFGNNTIGDLIGLAIVASIFGWNNGGFGGFGGGANGAGFLSNQLNNDSGRELIMNAINSNGEASRAAIQNLATMLGQDYNTVNGSLQNVLSVLNNIGAQQGMNALQVINEIQRGNASMASALQSCCCENRLSICQQTNTLTTQADRNANSIINAINGQTIAMNDGFCAIKERELQLQIDAKNDLIDQLRAQANNQLLVNQFAAMVAPLQAQINAVSAKLPNTVPVVWPELTVTPATATVSTGN